MTKTAPALLALKEEEGATSQGMYVDSSWKRQENGLSPGTSGRNPALLTPEVSPVRPGLTSDLWNCKIIHCIVVSLYFCYSSHGKPMHWG